MLHQVLVSFVPVDRSVEDHDDQDQERFVSTYCSDYVLVGLVFSLIENCLATTLVDEFEVAWTLIFIESSQILTCTGD